MRSESADVLVLVEATCMYVDANVCYVCVRGQQGPWVLFGLQGHVRGPQGQ
jgi:hypothetical protein